MEFCTIQRCDMNTVDSLLQVYAQGADDTFPKEYAGYSDEEARAAYAELISSFISHDDRYLFALREGETIVSALRVIHISQGNWYLEALGTALEYRGQGCARRLLDKTLRCMRALSARSIVSVVRADNAASLAVHEACGFTDTGKRAKDMEGVPLDDCIVYRYTYLK